MAGGVSKRLWQDHLVTVLFLGNIEFLDDLHSYWLRKLPNHDSEFKREFLEAFESRAFIFGQSWLLRRLRLVRDLGSERLDKLNISPMSSEVVAGMSWNGTLTIL